eukprot:4093147-Prymnesium_polylepis.1
MATTCGTTVPWGSFPCVSFVYDWRYGTLLPESQWAPALYAGLCSVPTLLFVEKTVLPKISNCSVGMLSAEYARSQYKVEVFRSGPYWPDEDEYLDETKFRDLTGDFVKDMMQGLADAQNEPPPRARAPRAAELCRRAPRSALSGALAAGGADRSPFYDLFADIVLPDMFLAVYSVFFILLCLALNTGSFLLMLAGIWEILISIPIAIFCWRIMGQTIVDALQLLGIFLILCIGADDIFVFVDTWKESAFNPNCAGSIPKRFAWSYKRAAGTMLTTTLTTALCLFLNASSKYAMIQAFGIFSARHSLIEPAAWPPPLRMALPPL